MTAPPLPFPAPIPETPFRKHGLGYCYEPTKTGQPIGIRLEVSDLRSRDGDLFGFVSVTSTLPGLRARLHGPVKHNLTIDRTRESLPKALTLACESAIPVEDWRQIVDDFCRLVWQANRRKGRVEELGNQDIGLGQPDVIEKLIQYGAITNLFGPGDGGKGWLGIALALCVRYGRDFCGLRVHQGEPLYLDWEDSRETFIRRVRAVATGLGLEGATLPRLRPVGTLAQNLDQIAEYATEHRLAVIVADSVGHASSQIGQHGTYEDAAKELFDAIAVVGESVAWLLIDHVSAEGLIDPKKLAGKPMNSVRKLYDARVAWECRSSADDATGVLSVGLYHTKRNNTAKYAPIGFRLEFDSDPLGRANCVRFSRQDVLDAVDLSDRLPLPARVLHFAKRGPLTIPAVAEEFDVGIKVAAVTVRRLAKQGKLVDLSLMKYEHGKGNIKSWGLADSGEKPSDSVKPDRETSLKENQLFPYGSGADAPEGNVHRETLGNTFPLAPHRSGEDEEESF